MSIFENESKLLLNLIEKGENLPLWQYHLFAPFLMNRISNQIVMRLAQNALDALDKPLYPYTQQDVIDRWDAISLLSSISTKLSTEIIESFAIFLIESLHFRAAPVRANAALAILEILNKIKNQSLLANMSRRLNMLVNTDKSMFVQYFADLAIKKLKKTGISSNYIFYRGGNPLSGIESSKLFHRFIRLWITGNIEFYQGDYKRKKLALNMTEVDTIEPQLLNDFTFHNKIPLPLSYLQFLVDIANGGQLSRMTNNLQLLHNDQWIQEDEQDPWQVSWVSLYPARPNWVSCADNGVEYIPDELQTNSISKRFTDLGDLKNASQFSTLVTLIEDVISQTSLNFDYRTEENLRKFNFKSKNISRNALKFYLWINQPMQL